MTQTINGSAYPIPVDELLPRAHTFAQAIGDVPSRNRLMSEFRIGAPKAQQLRDTLDQAYAGVRPAPCLYPEPIGPDPASDTRVRGDLTEWVDWGATRFRATGQPPTADELAAEFGIDADRARNVSELLGVAAQFRARRRPQTQPPDPVDSPVEPDPVSGVPVGPAESVDPAPAAPVPAGPPLVTVPGHPASTTPTKPALAALVDRLAPAARRPRKRRRIRTWPVWLLALPAFVAIWSGWVGLGGLTGFGVVHPLPGIADSVELNTAILLPIGVETYGAYALRIWMSGAVPPRARRFAKWSAIGSLLLGSLGQVAYHLMTALGLTHAPWPITTVVACLPVAVLGMGAGLAHLIHDGEDA